MEEFEVSTTSRKTKSVYISTVISIALVLLMTGLLGLILVHGFGFLWFMVFNMFTILLIFIIRFHYAIYNLNRTSGYEE